jgi:cytoskeletal protein CcmA (bactofilin family)
MFSRSNSRADKSAMAKERQSSPSPTEGVISIVGPGMKVVGDLETEGTLRIEGVVNGSVRAAMAVVIGKEGSVEGDVHARDAVIAGRVVGRVVVESRLELQATSRLEGEVVAQRLQLEEGAVLNGPLSMGESAPVDSRPSDLPASGTVDVTTSFGGAAAGPN